MITALHNLWTKRWACSNAHSLWRSFCHPEDPLPVSRDPSRRRLFLLQNSLFWPPRGVTQGVLPTPPRGSSLSLGVFLVPLSWIVGRGAVSSPTVVAPWRYHAPRLLFLKHCSSSIGKVSSNLAPGSNPPCVGVYCFSLHLCYLSWLSSS